MPHRLAGLTAAFIVLLTLAACGSDSGGGGSDGGDKVAHRFGTTTVPSEPTRVVTVGYNDHEFALALGVEPVAVRDWVGVGPVTEVPWAAKRIAAMKTKPKVLSRNDLNVEEIAKLNPDLIIGTFGGVTKRQYETLSRIAPTVGPPKGYEDFSAPWQEEMKTIAAALGRKEEGAKINARLEAQFAKAREDHPEFEGKSGLVPYAFPDSFGAYSSGDLRSRFLTELGFEIPDAVDKLAGKKFYVEFSKEQFRLLEQDALLVYGGPRSKRKDVETDPLYSRLQSVKDGRVVYMDNEDDLIGAVGLQTPYSIPFALREAVPRLADAVDGDPATKVKEAE